jgi:hypothetical protein
MKVNELLEGKNKGPGPMMSDELAVQLAKAKVPKEVIDALRIAMLNASVNTYALTYAHAMTKSFQSRGEDGELFGIRGVQSQVMYMLNNMQAWKGEEARECKKILNRWLKTYQ